MLDILFGQSDRRCDGVSRRDFLRIGAIGSIGLAGVLSAQSKARAGKHKARAKSVILGHLGGTRPPHGGIRSNPSFTWEWGKSAYLGGRYESFKTGDPNAPTFTVRDVSPMDPVTPKSAARRKTLLAAVDDLTRKVEGNDLISTYDE